MAEEFEQLQQVADRSGVQLRKDLLEMIQKVATVELERKILAALQKKQLQRVIQLVNEAFAPALAQYQTTLTNELLQIQGKTFDIAAKNLGVMKIVGRFDMTNPEAVNFARTAGSRFVKQLSQDTQDLLKSIVPTSFVQGIPVREAASQIRQSLGLTANQAASLTNYREFLRGLANRESLDALPSTVKARVRRSDIRLLPKTGAGMTEARIEKMVEKYRDRLLKERALTLITTETMAASNEGQLGLWHKAIDAELLTETGVRKKFITTPDDRLCPICKPMHGQLKKLDEEFVSPYNGARAKTPPMHMRCRCAMGLVKLKKKAAA